MFTIPIRANSLAASRQAEPKDSPDWSSSLMKKTSRHVYAVVRVDAACSSDIVWTNKITIKEIVLTEEEAAAEVARLMQVNRDKDCLYFWQTTRLVCDSPE